MINKNKVISIVIPNFNGIKLLEENLPKVVAARKNLRNNIVEIVVVDDFSTDGSAVYIKKNYPTIKLVVHKKNRRFSATVNTGVRTAKGDLICLQ